jgi:signal transduction histidine kinase/DNA-binding response OmpR family regulator
MNHISISAKLLLLSWISIAILVALGLYGVYNTKTTFQWVGEVYDTTSMIEKLFQEVGQPMDQVRRFSLMTAMAPNKDLQTEVNQERLTLIANTNKLLEQWKTQPISLAEEKLFQNFLTTWQQYQVLTNLTAEKAIQGYRETAFINATGAERQQFLVLLDQFSKWQKHKVNNAADVYTAANQNYSQVRWVAFTFIGVAIFLVLLISTAITRQITRPLFQVNEYLKILAQGKFVEEQLAYRGRDEIAEIIKSVQQLQAGIQSIITQANAIAVGNFSADVKLLSPEDQLGLALSNVTQMLRRVVQQANTIATGDYTQEVELRSDQDQLGQALANMTRTLRETTAQKVLQDWLKMGLTQLTEKLRGEQEMVTLAKQTIDFLTFYLDAQVGLFYRRQEDSVQSKSFFQRVASYAYTPTAQRPDQFYLGEGLVGQAAFEQRAITCTHQPEEYTHIIRSSLSQAIPRHVLLIPFLHESKVLGVIELGSFEALTAMQREFLEQAMPSLGIAVNSAEARDKMQLLLAQSQIQAKELQVQQTELQATNEELQAQSEELQTQQEELRQANEELEERARELERQKNAIKDNNLGLEKARQEIERKAQELEIASKYKSEFLANMSHELRTPLNSLLILAQLLADNKAGNLTDKQIEQVRTIYSAGSDLLNLINEVLDLSKIEAGKVDIHKEDLLLNDLVVTTQQKFQHIAEGKGLSFTINLADKVPAVLHTDGQRLNQIINNLLANAFKFTAQGEVKLEIRRAGSHELVLSDPGSSEWVAFSVSDTGIGIPKDKQQIIFEAFQQADGTTGRRYGGTGLGLTISRQLVRLLGGEIKLQSEAGKGSVFTVYLPLAVGKSGGQEVKQSEGPEVRSAEVTNPAVSSPKGEDSATLIRSATKPLADDRDHLQPQDRTLLMIEDDRNFLRTLIELARERDFKCIVAEDGKTGLQLASDYKPDAIILDVGLPEIDGWTVMERLKDNPDTRHIPVHFISAFDLDKDAKKMGAIGCLLKPIGMADLSEAFKKIEHFIATSLRHLLVVVDQTPRRQEILNLIGNPEVESVFVTTRTDAYHHLQQKEFDCIILDVDCEQGASLSLLEQLCHEDRLSQIPIIIYAERELTEAEEALLQHCENKLTIKSVHSPERLLDEATLFLHQLEANLPKEKQKMLRRVHDKQTILTGKKVLVVDDDVRNTFALMTFLDSQEMEVMVANQGKEALHLLTEHPDIDIVLMDIMMPEMDGYETMRQVRAQPRFRHLPIIALTAKAMKGDKAKCIEAGANDYLTKPVDTDKLVYLLRVWLYR